jgi:predicted lipid-binding transport protein (Tim44 family)
MKERSMKSLILALSLAVTVAALAPTDADARRIGGGSSAGMQRTMPARTPPPATPAQPAQPSQAVPASPNLAGAAPAAVAPKRSWMGPIAGLAAGLGIAALMSHFGMGAEFGNIIMMVLIAGLAFVAFRFLMARFAGGSARAGALAPMATSNGYKFSGNEPQQPVNGNGAWNQTPPAALSGTAASAAAVLPLASSANAVLPAGFDAAGFERIAKLIFVRMQAANDSADLNDLRTFTTPEMFAAIKLDIQDRGPAAQTTDVVRIDAEVLEVVSEAQRQIVSVRFHGLIREEKDGAANPFDEIWHLVKPADGSREWAIAGIQQSAVA